MKRISAILDPNGNPLVGLNCPDYIDNRVLTASTAEVHTVPTDAKYVLFSATADFYARFGAAAAVPGADVTDGTGSMLNPQLRSVDSETTIGLVSPTDCIVTLEFYG